MHYTSMLDIIVMSTSARTTSSISLFFASLISTIVLLQARLTWLIMAGMSSGLRHSRPLRGPV